jgi:glutathione S-transferase
MKLFTFATSSYARKIQKMMDYKGIAYEPFERCYPWTGRRICGA